MTNPLLLPSIHQTLQGVFQQIVPEATLVGVACVLFILSTFKGVNRHLAGRLTFAGFVLSGALHFLVGTNSEWTPIPTVSPIIVDPLASFIRMASLCTGIVLLFLTWEELPDHRVYEHHACLLCAMAGLSLVGMASDLIFLFLALELISIPTYVMLYLPRRNDQQSQEAAVKYFLLSILSSGLLLFGFSYLYGITGTTNINAIRKILPTVAAGDMSNMAIVAVVMITAGLGFRVTAFPFHFYAPDVYQGGPIGTVTLLAFVPKVAGFVAMIRLFGTFSNIADVAPNFTRQLILLMWILAAVTMTAGNVMALLQTNVRRMLAYSGVAHGGYMLIGLALLPTQTGRDFREAIHGGEAILFYLVAYGAMTIGAFAVIAYLSSPERPMETVDDFSGLHESHPTIALMMAIFLFSMIGLPLTAGFLAKFRIFMGALGTPATGSQNLYQILAIVGAVNAAIAAYYYLRLLSAMYLRSSFRPPENLVNYPVLLAMMICAILTLFLGVYPTPIWNATRDCFVLQ